MDLGLTDRVYVVTGGSRGLGRATAEALVGEGARVVLAARGAEAVAEAVSALGEDRAAGLAADLAAPDAAERLLAVANERFGRFDGALVSVGGPPPAAASAATDEQWRAAFESVFLGAVRAARTFAPALGEGGALGLVLSSSARSPIPGLAVSNGLRPGLAMVAKDLADEFGPRGVRVLGLMPGRIATDRTRQLDAGADPATRQRTREAIPLGRYGEPAEFGRVAAFLLSPAAGYVTGTTIPVDGGALRVP
ncbi:SDR family oxidoreductase [Streptomyces sp. 3MP-14]|uniref:SDR family oxidoreductase n=1 Tax=Streptomyces mimosae TaxID=2586635 RepID=A0A5N6AGR7_9ACTN|nr:MULTISPECIES: SDR family oxidoreductase [Streptomyces]KAB8166999.1 SDR family oxidoreductase [Streptomyces mimosae]KAB8176940.1 SDR family oxidoreductase [Streptomyces sp. 3MP-14]